MDKFANYYEGNEKRIQELSEYVHLNFKLIMTKMISEMRRKLDIEPDLLNKEGYVSLMASLQGRLFNEMVYALCGLCQSMKLNPVEVLPITTIQIFTDLMQGKNVLQGKLRDDITEDLPGFKKYYLEQIDELRKITEALPK